MAPLDRTTAGVMMTASADVDAKPATAAGKKEPESYEIEEGQSSSVATAQQAEPEKVTESNSEDVKWRAAYRIVTDVPVEKLWAVAKDFCNLQWFSLVTTCELLQGEAPGNTVGTVRHCVNEEGPWFSDERLVAIDHEKLTLTYKMINSSLGWCKYQGTLSVGRDQDGKNFVELRGEQSPRDNSTEEEAVQFMKRGYTLFVGDLEAEARTL